MAVAARPEWGMKASMEHMEKMWAWMQGTLVGTIDTRSFELHVTEFDWSKVNNVIYEENGVVIRTIPAIHFEQSVSFILEWNGLKLAYSSDTVPNKWWAEHTKGADLSIHECFFTAPMFLESLPLHAPGGAERQHAHPHVGADVRQDHGRSPSRSMPSPITSATTRTRSR